MNWKAIGPGLLFAGAAVGVSHLVQATRAGALYGVGLLVVVLVANVIKYPTFSFGPRYAAATGRSLLQGYRNQGLWALCLYAVIVLATMFTVLAAVTFVTAGLAVHILGLDMRPHTAAVVLLAVCSGLLAVGHYRWLDRVNKVVVSVLTVMTVLATVLVLGRIDWSTLAVWPSGLSGDAKGSAFVVALVGWMPSSFGIAVWHSLWTLAKRRESGHEPTVQESMVDFNIGYVGTAILAVCFLLLGAGIVHGTNTEIPASAGAFAAMIVSMYQETLGAWAGPVFGGAALMVMFSTTMTVIDGYPRSVAVLIQRFRSDEGDEDEAPENKPLYWVVLILICVGALVILYQYLSRMRDLVDLATTLSFVFAPLLAVLNHRAMFGGDVEIDLRPGRFVHGMSLVAIVSLCGFTLVYLTQLL